MLEPKYQTNLASLWELIERKQSAPKKLKIDIPNFHFEGSVQEFHKVKAQFKKAFVLYLQSKGLDARLGKVGKV